MWTHDEAIALCTLIEGGCAKYGCHVALTGGCLVKTGRRKDCDLVFYRIRHINQIDMLGLWRFLSGIGVTSVCGSGWRYVATYGGKPVDLLFPEETD